MNIWSGAWGLGDVLLLTAPCKYRNDLTIIMPKRVSRFAFLFDGLADVHLVDHDPINNNDMIAGCGTYSERMMRYCGLDGFDPTPKINIPKDYIGQSESILNGYENPIVFKPRCAPRWKFVREHKENNYWNFLRNRKENFLLFGSDDEFSTFDFVDNQYLNLDLPLVCALYSKIGKYVGVDTGDHHLMVACGGSCETHVPKSSIEYNHSEWHYNNDRITYFIWGN